jgi:hypothetical protein
LRTLSDRIRVALELRNREAVCVAEAFAALFRIKRSGKMGRQRREFRQKRKNRTEERPLNLPII